MGTSRLTEQRLLRQAHCWALLALFVCLFLASSSTPASASPPIRKAFLRDGAPAAVSAPVFADGWSWRRVVDKVESTLSSRARMIQLATIGMCIGLYILMRR